MDFLSICQTVNKLSGLHGQMTDVDSTNNLQNKISEAVNESWASLQNYRKDWTFMIKRHQTFTCTPGVEMYPTYDASVPDVGIEDLGAYKRRGFYLDHKPLEFISAAVYPTIDNTQESQPHWWTIDPRTNDLYLDLPDDNYTFDIYYRKAVQDLFEGETPNYNEPDLPPNYHNILVYAGLASFAIYIGNVEMHGKYELEYQKLLGSLMREFLPTRRILQRSII